jgi:hypothetical protein
MKHIIVLVKENNAHTLGYFLSDKLHEVVMSLCDEYEVNKIKINAITAGQADGLISRIEGAEIRKYGKTKLEIEVI